MSGQEQQGSRHRALPRLVRMQLKGFTLYSLKARGVRAAFKKPVFCLAGANGLGKSTFVAAANYALTGILAQPGRQFESVDEFFKDNSSFAEDYFSGRIDEDDRENAEIELEFRIGDVRFVVLRSPFERGELRGLVVEDEDGTANHENLSANELEAEFRDRVTKATGLSTFQQFAFLQHFLLTFDERRHLIFWDERVLTQILHMAFGVEPRSAERADALRREGEKHESRARNLNWRATQIRTQIEALQESLEASQDVDPDDDPDIQAQHEELTKSVDDVRSATGKASRSLDHANLKAADFQATALALREAYNVAFADRMGAGVDVGSHPLIQEMKRSQVCPICVSDGKAVLKAVTRSIDESQCPLCRSTLEEPSESEATIGETLASLDSKLATTYASLDKTHREATRLRDKLREHQTLHEELSAELQRFEDANDEALEKLHDDVGSSQLEQILAGYQDQLRVALAGKGEQRKQRDKKRRELKSLQKTLNHQYHQAEKGFLPLFVRLAKGFLGLDLNIELVDAGAVGLTLALEVRGGARGEHYQLSESQRFFIDIALRMALADFFVGEGSATMLVDTPEGSLDISYEARAGDMLADFVERGHQVIMTANINSSKLLLRLANRLGRDSMHVDNMMKWAELSEVQRRETSLFRSAFKEIAGALKP